MFMGDEVRDVGIRDHMANERTFLAWVRTNVGIIAFGFVIEKFGLFIKQMGIVLGRANLEITSPSHGYSATIGIFLICFGVLMNIFAYMNFKYTEKKIEERSSRYKPSGLLYALLISVIVLVGVFLVIYLIQSKF